MVLVYFFQPKSSHPVVPKQHFRNVYLFSCLVLREKGSTVHGLPSLYKLHQTTYGKFVLQLFVAW